MPRSERDSEDSPETPSGRGTAVPKSDLVATLLGMTGRLVTFDGDFRGNADAAEKLRKGKAKFQLTALHNKFLLRSRKKGKTEILFSTGQRVARSARAESVSWRSSAWQSAGRVSALLPSAHLPRRSV
jgi:hypothetical protein